MSKKEVILLEEKIAPIVRRSVFEALHEVLSDPDFGLPLRKSFETKLKKSVREKKRGKTYSFSEVQRILG